ncbi:alpha/beta hydrolase fold protein [Collybia nuda]|uniref:Alpha/beta hydrolase fold protein n=1 Tax=Collybia nuda TaxID=64659 RepID=A0A9P5XS22_9AGAR|nr:alpha/beta hydrolase fold protein [Collybia nuda]
MTTTQKINVDGVNVFYREAGHSNAPVFLLLHGFPSSSFQYRNLITKLATKYRVIAPDLPGFGFTEVPENLNYKYTFENLSQTIIKFTHTLNLTQFAIYIFDYGAPTGLSLALSRPDAITAIVSQNGNAFEEGLGEFWGSIRRYWEDPSKEKRDSIRFLLTMDLTKLQYCGGEANPDAVPPETYHLDQALLDRPGNAEIQLDLFLDYRNNVALYPKFHQYFREREPPLLAIWGKNDPIFIPPGANAFRTALPKAEVHLVDGGHFALENHLEEIHGKIIAFMDKIGL